MLPGQRDLLQYKRRSWNLSGIVSTWHPWKLVYSSTFLCLCSQYATLIISAYFTRWSSFSYATEYSIEFSIKSFINIILWMYRTILLWFASSFLLSSNWFKSVVSRHHVETNIFLVSRYWNTNAANLFKSISICTEKSKFSFIYKTKFSQSEKTGTAISFVSHRHFKTVQFAD